MFKGHVLIFEVSSVYRHASSSISISNVSSLGHEPSDNSVEDVPFVCEFSFVFASAELFKILCSFGAVIIV